MIPHVNDTKDDFDDVDLAYDIENAKQIKWYDQVLLNRPLKVVTAFILTAILAPILIYQLLFFTSVDQPPSDGLTFGSCLVPRDARLLCGSGMVDSNECHVQCCYDQTSNMCFHRFPSRFSYTTFRNWTEETLLNPRVATVPYASQRSLTNIRLSINEVSSTHLSLTFYDSSEQLTGQRLEEKDYIYEVSHPELNVIVNATGRNIFNSMRGPLIASNNIWEIAFKITDETMFGLGEIPIKEGTVKILYSHDGGVSSIPLIFAKTNGSYHGLLIDITTPTEVSFRGENQIVVRSITDWGLKFHLFVGPTPDGVMRDAIKLMEANRKLDYWMLGAHFCRESPNGTDQLEALRSFVNNANTQRVPYDSHCGIAPIVFKDQCDQPNIDAINQGIAVIKNAGKRIVPHVSPYVLYTVPEGIIEENDTDIEANKKQSSTCINMTDFRVHALQKPESADIYIGQIRSHDVIYPDYENLPDELMKELWQYNTEVDGLILENNWPLDQSNKKVNEIHLYLPYFNENFEGAFNATPLWNATKPDGNLYFYTHNQYGNNFVTAVEKTLGPLPISTTSQWMNGEVVVNRQNISTSWTNLEKELVEASLGGVSGHWLWSTPVCGDTDSFNNETQINLCIKWYMAAVYMPLIKIHSKDIPRDPLSFVGNHRIRMISALNTRMSLLPYFYTVLQEGPLLRPMFYQFPKSESLSNLTTQFAVGDNILIVPNLLPSQSHVHIWMPPGTWYEFWGGMKIDAEEGEAVTMTTTESDFLSLVRGGSVIPLQKDVRLTSDETRENSPFTLIVALECSTDKNDTTDELRNQICLANGILYMTENLTIIFEADEEEIVIKAIGDDFISICDSSKAIWAKTVNEISIYGLDDKFNNYDYSRMLSTDIDLCRLESDDQLNVKLVE